MTDDRSENQEHGLLGALLAPLRAPQRVFGDIETIATALIALQSDARDRLASIDEHAGALLSAVGAIQTPVERIDGRIPALQKRLETVITERMDALQAPLDRLDDKVSELQSLERVITERMDAIDNDLNERMLAVEAEVRAMRSPIEQMSRDLGSAVKLLPDPNDGPLTRLKDTFTSS